MRRRSARLLAAAVLGAALVVVAAAFVAGDGGALRVPPLAWQAASADGVEWMEFPLRAGGAGSRSRVVVVRLDPARVRFSLAQRAAAASGDPDWNIRHAPTDAVVALNAGQFTGSMPWGLLVERGVERLPIGHGPLSSVVLVHTDGSVRIVQRGDALLDQPDALRGVALAFQSYPTLLVGAGETPALLDSISRTHRDARLALGLDAEGRVLLALTRFDLLGGALDRIPFGLTTPEMAAVMQGLGAQQAVMLDGGLSAQLLVRTPAGDAAFPGSRRVPLALLVHPRPERTASPAR
jgi:uncharacterized protein YigE (DUF2233 family)